MKLKTKRKTLLNEKQLKAIQTYSVIYSKVLQPDGRYLVEYTRYNMDLYNDIANALIREKYSESEELALNRKFNMYGINDEYIAYNSYVESCVAQAKEFIAERVALFGK